MNFHDPVSYYLTEDHTALALAATHGEVWCVIDRVLERMPSGITVVCGPISTGGCSIEDNLKRFNQAIVFLATCGENVFSQLPFENTLRRIRAEDPSQDGLILLEAIYLPLFSHKKVVRQCFIHGWQRSFGATWEHSLGKKLGLQQDYFRENFTTILPDTPPFYTPTT